MENDYRRGLDYARKVVEGDIVVGKWVKLQCEKFLNELDNDNFEFYFDTDRAQHVCSFFEVAIKHVTGPMAGKPMVLSDWEILFLINCYGWVHRNNMDIRRFHQGILQVGRKNNKSTMSGGLPIYDMIYGDQGAQVFSVATKRDQAKIVWKITKQMIKSSPSLRNKLKITQSMIENVEKFCEYTALGRDSNTQDGLNPSLVVADEAAAIKDRNVIEVLTSATGSRDNYLFVYITTAQPNKETIYYEKQQYLKGLLSGEIEDDTWFGLIYEPDEGDDWLSDEALHKANPNIGRSISLEYLQQQRKEAEVSPSARANFKIKHLNLFLNTHNAWLEGEVWDSAIIDKIDRTGDLWVGVDLGSTSDLTSLVFLYRNGEKYHVEHKCFLPESALEEAPKYVKPLYKKAIESGELSLTPGNATDYGMVKEYLQNYIKDKELKEIAYDPWSAQKFSTELIEEGAPMVEVNQGMRHLSPATKDTEIHLRRGEILHEDLPLFQWQFNNASLYVGPNESIKVVKGDDKAMKIDSVVALTLAVSRASSNGGLKKRTFHVYS